MRVAEVLDAGAVAGGRQAGAGLGDIVADAALGDRLAAEVVVGRLPVWVEVQGERVELHQDEAPAGNQYLGDAVGPALEVGEPDQRAVGGEDPFEAFATGGGDGQPAEDVVALEVGGDAAVAGQLTGEVDGAVGDVDPGDAGAKARQAQAVLSGVALQMQQAQAVEMAEQLQFLGIERGTAVAEEGGLVGLVAVVRPGGGVPRQPVGLVQVGSHGSTPSLECATARMAGPGDYMSLMLRTWSLLTRVRLPSSCSSS
ncbi:hypothetical protein PAERUG_P19_London_7_VIM_2_05_10_00949 [Pseudomonas aeruginosa]|uniref:Uncharacterized protein n=1 Tax=Pseudomonas aeruginosa TaxID=287 RepID=A0A9P1VVB7_PSEAI|nr:hypothetical protein PAERUG_P36_West_Midlands_5_VIM_2_06_12_00046 [Pseudomonas aeruginosa]CRO11602.1 hypothetical protein PAERUG_P1_London_28_IMP_1_04_05_01041 [Pseudomonas aeruginosa]CRO16265.1 hypothetical protein PAERUG_P19_London_7_VIM_2_05_10_00949 [Pseudomonas aeruginosa]CRO16558.1 hypothetical protein PAERUG_P4_London_1_VIM_2_10_07_00393 [Pseudomonas aeruginosa]CRO39894.1 hypothetical protein PAERUG_P15_London_17_VIM_2_02_10_01081 [Pseudomonas aeruginosa]